MSGCGLSAITVGMQQLGVLDEVLHEMKEMTSHPAWSGADTQRVARSVAAAILEEAAYWNLKVSCGSKTS